MIDPIHPVKEYVKFQELHVSVLQRLSRAAIVVGILWFAYIGIVLESIDLALWSGPLWLNALGFATLYLLRHRTGYRGYLLAALLFSMGIVVAILAITWATDNINLLLLMALPAGIVGLLLGTPASLLFASTSTLILWTTVYFTPLGTMLEPVAFLTTLSIWLTTLLIWMAIYPLHMAADLAWASFEQASIKTEQARADRAQLARVLKELDTANKRLTIMTVELERARQAAVESRRLKEEFVANISHELRTPLNLIIGFSEMMTLAPEAYSTTLPPVYRADLLSIFRNARHLSDLVDDVLDLSQLDAGRMGLMHAPVSVVEIINEAVDTVAALFQRKQLPLHLNIAPDLPVIDVDRTRIRQVLINLLNNAARFTEKGEVTLCAVANKQEVTLTVTDTGPGIAPEMLPQVFQEFSSLNQRLREQHGGSGLGLAISKKFVELHGGHMGVRSEVGRGTTFSFSLPRSEELGIEWQPSSSETWVRISPRVGRRKTIALLTQDASASKLFARYLEDYEIITVADRAALWQLGGRTLVHAALVVVDAGEAGWLALRKAREGLPNVPILLCTLRGGIIAQRPAQATYYLTKPVSQEQFVGILNQLEPSVRRLLIVDDAPEIVRLLSRMTQRAERSFQVARAYSGSRALEMIAQHPPDALVLDLLMPETDGYAILEELHRHPEWQSIPVIVVTARGRDEESITAGMVGLTHPEGLTIGEAMRSLKASLDAFLPLPSQAMPQSQR